MTPFLTPDSPSLDKIPSQSEFRTIHYLGSKARLLDDIEVLVRELNPSNAPVCDLFSGSGAVAARMSCSWEVTSVDVQEYARVLASALISPQTLESRLVDEIIDDATATVSEANCHLVALSEYEDACTERALLGDLGPLANVVEEGSMGAAMASSSDRVSAFGELVHHAANELFGADGMCPIANRVCFYYGGVFFSYRQAMELDALAEAAERVPSEARDTVFAAIVGVASAISGTVGNQFAQPLRPRNGSGDLKQSALKAVARVRQESVIGQFRDQLQRYRTVLPRPHANKARRIDFREFLAESEPEAFRVVYADPPYTRDHYSRFYHVLETICNRADPGLSMTKSAGAVVPSRGLYRVNRHQSPFCIKSQARGAFLDLFDGVARLGSDLVLSYSPFESDSHPRLLTIDAIVELAESRFYSIEIVPAGAFAHSKFNASHLRKEPADEAELFLICRI